MIIKNSGTKRTVFVHVFLVLFHFLSKFYFLLRSLKLFEVSQFLLVLILFALNCLLNLDRFVHISVIFLQIWNWNNIPAIIFNKNVFKPVK